MALFVTTVLASVVFASALAGALGVFWFTLKPALPRIVALLRYGVDPYADEQGVAMVSELRLRARIRASSAPVAAAWRAAA